MTDTATRAGGRAPGDGTTYNPLCGEDFPPGTPVCQSRESDADGTVIKAQADGVDTGFLTGLAAGVGVTGNRCNVQWGNVLTLTIAEWDVVTGGSGGLVRGIPYYLSSTTAGRLTATAPSAGGTLVAPAGVALSPTDMLVQISVALEN